jgi:hypothetical protein
MDLICDEFHRLGIRQPARTFPNGGGGGGGGRGDLLFTYRSTVHIVNAALYILYHIAVFRRRIGSSAVPDPDPGSQVKIRIHPFVTPQT